jgi:hypothetical protein
MEACTAINNQQELNAFENLIRNEDIRHEKDICSTLCKWIKALQQLFWKNYNDNVSTFKQ